MGKVENKYVPSIATVQNEGNTLEIIGAILVALSVISGLAVLFASGNPAFLLTIPVGLMVFAVAYLKKIAAATTASYVLQIRLAEIGEEESSEVSAEQ